jgi:DNA-directed RNA polymerase subunit K/omega
LDSKAQRFSAQEIRKMADEENAPTFGLEGEEQEDGFEVSPEEGVNTNEQEGKPVAGTDPLQLLFYHHPECKLYYAETITPKLILMATPPDHPTRFQAPDANHRSQPWITQYERTKILGFRANQLAKGARPYIEVPKYVVDTLEIARLELKERRLPFIISRSMPDGTFEFWRLSDMMIL